MSGIKAVMTMRIYRRVIHGHMCAGRTENADEHTTHLQVLLYRSKEKAAHALDNGTERYSPIGRAEVVRGGGCKRFCAPLWVGRRNASKRCVIGLRMSAERGPEEL